MSHLVSMLVNRHHKEQTVGYTECHDQALVGGQSMAFALMGAEMYEGMSAHGCRSPRVERGVALHKMTRLLTLSLGGEAYLNFMGNEFGHPDWIDFPREGNNDSFEYARRRWDLADNTDLLYSKLQLFDAAMLEVEKLGNVLRWGNRDVTHVNDEGKVIVFEVGRMLFCFNFHPSESYAHYNTGVLSAGEYKCCLDTDAHEFGGHNRVDPHALVGTWGEWRDGRPNSICLYLPSCSAQVYQLVNEWDEGTSIHDGYIDENVWY
mmetsp:Transcript_27584/g.52165  ORF Transcript_27584/g.52165 Transcript_27584/m.52165 type:complete len:263 (+) Transcript_27584:78-866(+)